MDGPVQTAKAEAVSEVAGSATSRVASAWASISRRGRAVTVASGLVGTTVAMAWLPETAAAVATGFSLLVMLTAALVDAVEHRLPNVLVVVAAIPVVLTVTIALASGSGELARGALLGAAILGGPLLVTHLVSPSGMGFGDVKAGAVLGAALGLINAQIAVLALLLGLSGAAVWALARRRGTIALGPGLVAGAVVALAVARQLNVEAFG